MTDRYEKLVEKVLVEFPRFQVKKVSGTWLGVVMRLMGRVTKKPVGAFTTTIGSTIYVADDWDGDAPDVRYATLRHELMHIRQFHYWPLGAGGRIRTVLNHVLMGFAYLFLCPFFWTFRAKFEREGYAQTLLVSHELYGPVNEKIMESKAGWLAEIFAGSSYLWMWRREAAHRWAIETQKKINEGFSSNPRDRVD